MDEMIYGRNPVLEALASDANLQRIYLLKDNQKNKDILAEAKKRGLPIDYHDRTSLTRISGTENHQGVAAQMAPLGYVEWEDILSIATKKGETPLILICDHLEDPHNLGAIIRSAVCFGAHGIILPKKRSVAITSTVLKASAGAAMHIKVARVSNLAQTIDRLKQEGLWIVGTDADGESLIGNTVLTGPLAIVVGSEGKGMSTLTRKKCDLVLKIPMESTINSLNASVATGIVLYETSKLRG
ncbi:23S rRNA (guanosine(2251)-2'-O)-methyltransferase RlmB [Clostridia bacterium]|nr:23S rRNA (guanosine(2251)-2'-O)-methyltransferase RlmB [Clostridia bacterium]